VTEKGSASRGRRLKGIEIRRTPEFGEEFRQTSSSNTHHNLVWDVSTFVNRPALILRLEAKGVSNHIFDATSWKRSDNEDGVP
jgi:hypothetical protein